MRIALFILGIIAPTQLAHAQVMYGTGTALDGDTLDIGQERVRLFGIDAVEAKQTCTRDNAEWACGDEAKQLLAELIAGQSLQCQHMDRDQFGRMVAVCNSGGRDVGKIMVDAGLAIALPHFSSAYVEIEEHARNRKAGIWNSTFATPSEFRAANPHAIPSPKNPKALAAPRYARQPQAGSGGGPSGVFYRNCNAARAAGAAPLYRGQPGYRPDMDGDNDGVACEPYRRR